MNVTSLPRPRRGARAPLRVGDVWVYVGPGTELTITGLAPRPTAQKPWSQAVTLSSGKTIAEATLRTAYMRQQEYLGVFMPQLREKLRAGFNEMYDRRAEVIPFPARKAA